MAVTEVREYKRSSGKKLVQQDQYLVPAYTKKRFFQVILDDPATDHAEIYDHADIPKLFEPHPDDEGVICKSIDPDQSDDEASYEVMVTAEYDDQYSGSEEEDEEENADPLNRPVQVSLSFNEHDEIVIRDIDGDPVQNSALDPFDPPLTRKAGSLRFGMTKNYPSLDLPFLQAYKNAINSDTWNGFDPGVVRIANITGSKQIESMRTGMTTVKVVYWQLTFEFELAETGFGKDGTWKAYVLDQGYRLWPLGEDAPFPIYASDGTPVSTPAPLDGAGDIGDPASPQWLQFDIYRPLPFAALGLL